MKSYIELTAFAFALACGASDEYLDELPNDQAVELGSASQNWVSYATSGGTYWGTQTDVNGSKCQSSQSATTNCRFVTMGGLRDPNYIVSVSNSFAAASRTLILTLMNNIVSGEPAVIGLNQQTGFPCNTCTVQPEHFSVNSTVGSQSRIHIVPNTITQDGTMAMRNFVRVSFTGCGSNLPEEHAMPGLWKACTGALISIDLPAIDAATTSPQYSRAVDQSITHGIFMAIGLGTEANVNSFRHAVLRAGTFTWSQRLTASELCLLRQFVDQQGDGQILGDPGPLWDGDFVGC